MIPLNADQTPRQGASTTLSSLKVDKSDSTGVDTARFLYRLSEMPNHLFLTGPRQRFPVLCEGTGELLNSGLNYGPTQLASGPGLWVEGRPDQLFNGKGHDELLPLNRFVEADELVRENLGRLGVKLAGRRKTEVARIDTTASIGMENPMSIQATLRALGASSIPLRRTATYKDKAGNVETLYFVGQNSKKLYERIYPEGPKHGPGREKFLRFEAQNRYDARTRLPVQEWTADRAQETFAKRFGAHRERVSEVIVGNADVISTELVRLYEEGEITRSAATRLAGYLLHRRNGNHKKLLASSSISRYEAELRRINLDLDEECGEPLRLDLRHLFERTNALSWS